MSKRGRRGAPTLTTVTASHYLPTISSQRTNTPPFQSHISSPPSDMSDQSGSPLLRVLFEAALEDYKQQTGIELVEHPLAERLQDCDSVESVTAIIREQAQNCKEFRQKRQSIEAAQESLNRFA